MNKVLITGGAGFIGSNLVDYFLSKGYQVVCLDNFATGFRHNIDHHKENQNFKLIEGDIRDLSICKEAVKGCDYVLHQAALGSVPRSIKDPITSNDVNVGGFVNMLVAARDEGIKRFIYAASSSTYGDSKKLPKVEEEIGKPLSPYAITKYVNELYADVFSKTYGMQCIGLRYFNVFGRRQDPNGAYAAVIPLWVKCLLNHESPIINGDGSYSRDFTYIDNVIEANEKAMLTALEDIHKGRKEYYNIDFEKNRFGAEKEYIEYSANDSFAEVFNVAYGGNTNLIELFQALKDNLGIHDAKILDVEPTFGPNRPGDIPHSKASIEKARMIIDYNPQYNATEGFKMATEWYFNHIK